MTTFLYCPGCDVRGTVRTLNPATRDLVWERVGRLGDDFRVLVQKPATGVQRTIGGVFQHGRLVACHASQLRVRGVGGAALASTRFRSSQ